MVFYQQQRDFPRGRPRYPQAPPAGGGYDNFGGGSDDFSPHFNGQQEGGLLPPPLPPPGHSVAAPAPPRATNLPPNSNYGAFQQQQQRHQMPYQQQPPQYAHQFQQQHIQPFHPNHQHQHQSFQHQTPPQQYQQHQPQYGRPFRYQGNQNSSHHLVRTFGRGGGHKRPFVNDSAPYQSNTNGALSHQALQPPLPRDPWQQQQEMDEMEEQQEEPPAAWSNQPSYAPQHAQPPYQATPQRPFVAPNAPPMPYAPAPPPGQFAPPPAPMQPAAPAYQNRVPHSGYRTTPNSRPPPPSYVCHKCHQPGHWIQDCSLGYRQAPHSANSAMQPPPPLPPAAPTPPILDDFPGEPPHHSGFDPNPPPHAACNSGEATAKGEQPAMQWRCEACDKSFVMLSQHEAHVKTHVQCSATDCDFEASKRVVSAHFQTCHGVYSGQGLKEIDVEGQKFMVLVGNSPEDIAKWREERRKKWPSAKNMQHKQDTRLKRQLALGQVAPDAAGSGGSSGSNEVSGTKRKREEVEEGALEEGEVDEEESGVEPGSSDPLNHPVESGVGNSSGARAGGGSSDQQQGVANKEQKKPRPCAKFVKGCCRFGARCRFSHDLKSFACSKLLITGKCPRGNKCLFSHDQALCDQERPKYEAKAAAHQHQQQQQAGGGSTKKQKVSHEQQVEQLWKQENKSLLRKLLHKDIRCEQKQLLQIIHYAVTRTSVFGAAPVVSEAAATAAPDTDEKQSTPEQEEKHQEEPTMTMPLGEEDHKGGGEEEEEEELEPDQEDEEDDEEQDLPLPKSSSGSEPPTVQVAVA